MALVHIGVSFLDYIHYRYLPAFNALMLMVGWQEGHLSFKKTEGWAAGMVICLE